METAASPKTGFDKAKEVANKIKGEKKEKEETMALAKVQADEELSKLFNESAQIGADNLSGNSPTLTVYSAGKSQSRLADGTKPTDGFFFYKPTQTQYETLTVHILSISQGFRAPGMTQKDGTAPMIFNQLISGVFNDEDGEIKPFIMYVTGKKLAKMWEFGKEANKYTHAKPVAIPMFALSVKLTTVEEANDFGSSWLINFEILKNESGSPIVVTDVGEFTYLRDLVKSGDEMINTIIKAKASEETEDSLPLQETTTPRPVKLFPKSFDKPTEELPPPDENLSGEEIPF